MDHRTAIHCYYQAFRHRDRESLQNALTPDFHFVSAFGEFHGRDTMLEAIWPSVGQAWATNLRIFGTDPEFVVLYEHETAPGAGRPAMAMAEHLRFEGDRIARVEVFVGRPLSAAP
jgi:SnoaL-like domain